MEATELKNGTEQKTEEKEFNVNFAYVVSEIYSNQYFSNDCSGELEDDSWRLYSYIGIFYSLKKRGQLVNFEVVNTDKTHSKVIYKYNRAVSLYPNIEERAERRLKLLSLQINPTGDMIKQKEIADIERIDGKNNEFTERISPEDRCTGELNKMIAEELEEQMSKVSPKKGKAA